MITVSLKVLGFLMALGMVAQAGLPYLPLTGPVPMRVLAARSPAHSIVKFASQANTNGAAENAAATLFSTNTNQTAAINPVEPTQSLAGFASGDKNPDTVDSAIFTLTTPDLLGISPQALAVYFHPVQRGTNIVVPDGLQPISFVPPLPLAQKSSQAEYRVK